MPSALTPTRTQPSFRGRKRLLLRLLMAASMPAAVVAIASPAAAADTPSAATSTATLTPAAPSGTNNWYRGPVTLNLSAADTVGGVQRIEYRLGSTAPFQTAVSANAPF